MPSFTQYRKTNIGYHVVPSNGASGDFNGDGAVDLIWASSIDLSTAYPSDLLIYLGPTFSQSKVLIDGMSTYPTAYFARDVDVFDVNSDGIDDIFVFDQSERSSPREGVIFQGGPQYAYISNGPSSFDKVPLADGDFNTHGYGFIHSADANFQVVLNTPWSAEPGPEGIRTIITEYDPALNQFDPTYLTAGSEYHQSLIDADNNNQTEDYFYQFSLDINADGNDDVISMTNWLGGNGFYLNDGHGGFHFQSQFEDNLERGHTFEEVTVGDFNSDGYLDFVGLFVERGENPTLNKTLRVFINDEGKTFRDETNIWLGDAFEGLNTSFGYMETFDFNSDGYDDFVWNHFNGGPPYTFKLDVFISDGGKFNSDQYLNLTGPRLIKVSKNEFVANGALFEFSSTIKAESGAVLDSAITRLPGKLTDYFIQDGNDLRIFHSSEASYKIASEKEKVRFDDTTLDFGEDVLLPLNLEGNLDKFTLTLSPSSTIISERNLDASDVTKLVGIETIYFANEDEKAFDLTKFGRTAGLSEQDFEAFIELYIAYFNRAPDAIGLNFWGSAFANGMSLDEIAAEFAPQPETVATYPEGTSNTEFVTTVYNNILGRGPDQGGLDFWVNGLEEGGLTRDTFILKLLGGVEDGNSDRAYLDNKVDLGAYFAVHKGMSDGENAKAVMDLFGDQDVSNTSGAKTAIDDYYTDALDPTNGEFLLQVVGVLDNPFDVA